MTVNLKIWMSWFLRPTFILSHLVLITYLNSVSLRLISFNLPGFHSSFFAWLIPSKRAFKPVSLHSNQLRFLKRLILLWNVKALPQILLNWSWCPLWALIFLLNVGARAFESLRRYFRLESRIVNLLKIGSTLLTFILWAESTVWWHLLNNIVIKAI